MDYSSPEIIANMIAQIGYMRERIALLENKLEGK
jgi:hypothetical protein